VKTIRSAPVGLRYTFADGALQAQRVVPGFLIEAVIPRRSLTEVRERFWMTPDVPVFGVARWDRDDEALILIRHERGGE
jgi:hypothetical protein